MTTTSLNQLTTKHHHQLVDGEKEEEEDDDDNDEEGEEESLDEEEEDDDEQDQNDDDDEEDDDDDDEDDEEDDDDEDDDDEEEEDDDDDDEDDEDDDDDEDDSEDIVDPGQHCHHPIHQPLLIDDTPKEDHFNEGDESYTVPQDLLDHERMLEVTRKLVRNTERDPDRDLRKQVLLKTAIKKLPDFMEFIYGDRYSNNLDRSFHSNMSPQAYYEHHDSQQKLYHTVQPNAIQMSTTSLRMLDLNDDHDPDLNAIDQDHDHHDPNMSYGTRTSLDQHDYVNQGQYDRYHQRSHELNHYETANPMISRHNSLDNLYQPIHSNEITEEMKDGSDERIPIAFQIACEIYDFTCTPDDNDRKLLDNLTNGYYSRPTSATKDSKPNVSVDGGGEDGTDNRDQEGSDASSSSTSSTSSSADESANSIVSQLSDEANGTSLLETSLNSSNDFYHSSHDSGVALFSPRSNKRSSSSIGLDDEMEIDHLTELSTRSPSIGSNSQYKKLRKKEIID